MDKSTRDAFRKDWKCSHNSGALGGYTMNGFRIWCNGDIWILSAPNKTRLYTARHLDTIINRLYAE